MRRRNWRAVGCVLVELVAQRADRDAENIGRVRAVAVAMLECLQDQIALDFSDCTADQIAGDLLGRYRRMGGDVRAAHLIEPTTVG